MKIFAVSALFALGITMVSCQSGSVPKASLNNPVDSLSYAYGVNLADQGLTQFLEQQGVLTSTTNIEYEYQAKIASADSTQKDVLQKEMQAKIDSVNNENAPKLNDFIKGLKEAMNGGKEKAAYISGLSIGSQISQQMLPQFNSMVFAEDTTQKVNKDQLLAGLIGTLKDKNNLAIPTTDADAFIRGEMEKAQQVAQKKKEEELKIQYKDSIAAGEKFMAENAKRESVITLPSGLQYEILKKGNGPIPTENDRVKVHYHGTLINGTVFDSSVDRGEPAVFGVTQVIPGWTEALKLMPVGSKWRLYVPYNLAYGGQDRGTIKPFSNLIFDVQLLGIEK